MAILYRNNFLSRRLEEELNGRGIPYIIFGGFRFFERSEIKDMIAYLRVIVNPDDDAASREQLIIRLEALDKKLLM